MTDYDKILEAARARKGKATVGKLQESTAAIEQIKDRALGDTRPLTLSHARELAESIAVLGLIEPLVVDNQNRLLAGGHRRAAIQLLQEEQPDVYEQRFPGGQIPVRVMPFDSEEDSDLALAIETAENEKRRDYTPSEVIAIADRLKAAGYADVKGRPRKGQKPLMPALTVVVGKNLRTVQRYLSGTEEPKKSTTDVALLTQAVARLKKWQKTKPQNAAQEKLTEKLPEIIALIESAIDQRE